MRTLSNGARRWNPRSNAVVVASLGWMLAGCPGGLDDPQRFLGDGGPVAPQPDTGAMLCPTALNVEVDIFQAKCAGVGCHPADSPASDLDLVTAGALTRLMGQATMNTACSQDPVVDTNNPRDTSLYKKVAGTTCGARMPLGGDVLSQEEIDCIEKWMSDG